MFYLLNLKAAFIPFAFSFCLNILVLGRVDLHLRAEFEELVLIRLARRSRIAHIFASLSSMWRLSLLLLRLHQIGLLNLLSVARKKFVLIIFVAPLTPFITLTPLGRELIGGQRNSMLGLIDTAYETSNFEAVSSLLCSCRVVCWRNSSLRTFLRPQGRRSFPADNVHWTDLLSVGDRLFGALTEGVFLFFDNVCV